MNDSNITSTNVSNDTTKNYYCKYNEPDSDLEKNAKFSALIFVGGFGILTNIFIIVLAVKYTVRKNLHHLIINMAVSDTIYSCVHLLFAFEYRIPILYPGVLGVIMCKLTLYIDEVSYAVSLMTLLVISIERFRATRKTLQRSRPYTLKQRMAVLTVCWLVPMIIYAYFLYYWHFDEKQNRCYVQDNDRKCVQVIEFVVILFKITVVIMISTFSILTIKQLSRPQAIQAHLNEEQRIMRARRTRAAVAMVFTSLLLYVCCWFPDLLVFAIVLFQKTFKQSNSIIVFSHCIDWSLLLYVTSELLPIVNSCFSPFIYIIFLSDFREAAKRVMCRRTSKQLAPTERIRSSHITSC